MKKNCMIIVLIFLPVIIFAVTVDTLFILHTTDIHGHLIPYDYFSDEPSDRGLARIFTKVQEYRAKHNNVLLIDSGDLIQGTPLTYYFNMIEPEVPNPMILALNTMNYDAFTVGNHDVEQGIAVYTRLEKQSEFPWLSANSCLDDGSTYYSPYKIIPMWLDESLYPGITWKDMVETADTYVDSLLPKTDILLGSFHSGFDENEGLAKCKLMGVPVDNASGLVVEKVPGFDVIFGGHSHRIIPQNKTTILSDETLKINSGCHGENLGVVRIIYQIDDQKVTILEKSGWVEPVSNIEPSEELLALSKPYHQKILKYIRKNIGTLTDTLSGKYSRFMDTPFMELVNNAQLDHTGADISFAACFKPEINIPPGNIKIKDIYNMYPYENYLYVVQMTGKQIEQYLEYSARYYVWDGNKISANPTMKGYNCDMAEGISYTIDVTQKVGKRIKDIIITATGESLKIDKVYKVTMNSYRASGGGGHMGAAKASQTKVIFKSSKEMRNILADYIRDLDEIPVEIDNNWHIEK
jgi:2',3'-cyclic-nucleotide 2'-phosphodiesterase/3'-nucleotidase